MQLFDLFVSNWPNSKETGLGYGDRTDFCVSRREEFLLPGTHAWEVGPAVAARYLGVPHLMIGFLSKTPSPLPTRIPQRNRKVEMRVSAVYFILSRRRLIRKIRSSTWTQLAHAAFRPRSQSALAFGRFGNFRAGLQSLDIRRVDRSYRQTQLSRRYHLSVWCDAAFPGLPAVVMYLSADASLLCVAVFSESESWIGAPSVKKGCQIETVRIGNR